MLSRYAKTCTIEPMKDGTWFVKFTPGLPYDTRTKGMPHREARLQFVTIQNERHHGVKHLMVFNGNYGDLYIHAMLPGPSGVYSEEDFIISSLKKYFDYTVVDSKDTLLIKAKSKLTAKELAAIKHDILAHR